MPLLSLIIAEAALELVPKSIARHPSVARDAARKDKRPEKILLDRSYHHAAMQGLKDAERRGRPDLVHFALLEATSIPLYQKDMLRVYVHTYGGRILYLGERVRLPKSFHRFEGVVEDLFAKRKVMTEDRVLMELKDKSFVELISEIGSGKVIGLSRIGAKSDAEEVARIAVDNDAALVVGGFPRGHFSKQVERELDATYSISDLGLEAHVVIARILYEYEKILFK